MFQFGWGVFLPVKDFLSRLLNVYLGFLATEHDYLTEKVYAG